MSKNDDLMHFWFNSETKMYEEGDEIGPAYTAPAKKLLEDGGTRFEHLNDLVDYLGEGLIAVNNSLTRYKNESDAVRKVKLEGALALIHIYQEQMANYSGQKGAFNKMLDTYVPTKETLALIRQEKLEKAKADKSDQKLGEGNDTKRESSSE